MECARGGVGSGVSGAAGATLGDDSADGVAPVGRGAASRSELTPGGDNAALPDGVNGSLLAERCNIVLGEIERAGKTVILGEIGC